MKNLIITNENFALSKRQLKTAFFKLSHRKRAAFLSEYNVNYSRIGSPTQGIRAASIKYLDIFCEFPNHFDSTPEAGQLGNMFEQWNIEKNEFDEKINAIISFIVAIISVIIGEIIVKRLYK